MSRFVDTLEVEGNILYEGITGDQFSLSFPQLSGVSSITRNVLY